MAAEEILGIERSSLHDSRPVVIVQSLCDSEPPLFNGSQDRGRRRIFTKLVDTPYFWRKLRAPMNHQSTTFCTRQRWALKVCAGNLSIPCSTSLRALEVVMR
jgi:hypothetical protein